MFLISIFWNLRLLDQHQHLWRYNQSRFIKFFFFRNAIFQNQSRYQMRYASFFVIIFSHVQRYVVYVDGRIFGFQSSNQFLNVLFFRFFSPARKIRFIKTFTDYWNRHLQFSLSLVFQFSNVDYKHFPIYRFHLFTENCRICEIRVLWTWYT